MSKLSTIATLWKRQATKPIRLFFSVTKKINTLNTCNITNMHMNDSSVFRNYSKTMSFFVFKVTKLILFFAISSFVIPKPVMKTFNF